MPNINAASNTFDIETTGTLNINTIAEATAANGIDVSHDMTLAQGKTVNLQGASGGPQSGTARNVLAKIGHILDGGHPANPYPTTRDADDAEFNNSTQAENNTIGTHAGGDFWEWSPGAPANDDINLLASMLYLRKTNADVATDRILKGNISAIGETETCLYEFVLLPFVQQKSGNWISLALYDVSTTNYMRVKFEDDATNGIQIVASYDEGAGEITEDTLVIGTSTPMVTLGLQRASVAGNIQIRYFFSLGGLPGSSHFQGADQFASSTLTLTDADLIPDELQLEISNGGGLQIWFVDSVRRTV